MSKAKNILQLLDAAPASFKKAVWSGWSGVQSTLFLLEAQPLRILDALIRQDFSAWNKVPPGYRKALIQHAQELLERDAAHFTEGLFPASILRAESPVLHGVRYGRVILDALRLARRKVQHQHGAFDESAQEYLADTPDYYRRNFHFQTDGYLSERSAELYDHQVDILFSGTADAMRRLMLPPLHAHFGKTDGTGLHFIDVACGTGTSSRLLAEIYPKAHITCVDLSAPYLAHARKNLAPYPRVNFMQANAASLPFTDQTFDAVCSTFLFHELPLEERHKVIHETMRVLKPSGFWGMVDSIQKDDVPELNWGLEQFPRDFHEPFYKNYSLHPFEALLAKAQLAQLQTEIGLFSKVVWGSKPATPPVPRKRTVRH